MYGCFERLLKTVLGLIFIAVLLVVAHHGLTAPYTPEKPTTGQTQAVDEGVYNTKQSQDEIKYEVPVQNTSDHDYIMVNTFQKSGVVMELTPDLERSLVYVIKVFKAVFGQDFTPTIISAHDSFDKHNEWSYHRTGRAVDIRTNDLPIKEKRKVFNMIEASLPKDFKIIWEQQYLPTEHFHLQSRH